MPRILHFGWYQAQHSERSTCVNLGTAWKVVCVREGGSCTWHQEGRSQPDTVYKLLFILPPPLISHRGGRVLKFSRRSLLKYEMLGFTCNHTLHLIRTFVTQVSMASGKCMEVLFWWFCKDPWHLWTLHILNYISRRCCAWFRFSARIVNY